MSSDSNTSKGFNAQAYPSTKTASCSPGVWVVSGVPEGAGGSAAFPDASGESDGASVGCSSAADEPLSSGFGFEGAGVSSAAAVCEAGVEESDVSSAEIPSKLPANRIKTNSTENMLRTIFMGNSPFPKIATTFDIIQY
jgi:hypothetical protein